MPARRIAALLALPLASCESVVEAVQVSHFSDDGLELWADYYRQNVSERVGTLLLLHEPGEDRTRDDWDAIWESALDLGFNLLAPDLRSHGASPTAGELDALSLDPIAYPTDVVTWLEFLHERAEAGDPIDVDHIGAFGLGATGSLIVGASARGHLSCAAVIGAEWEEVARWQGAMEYTFEVPGDDDSASSARGDDDSAAGDDDTATPLPDDFAPRAVRYIHSAADEPAATDASRFDELTLDPSEVVPFDEDLGPTDLMFNVDTAKDALLSWCQEHI